MDVCKLKPYNTDYEGLVKLHKEDTPIRPIINWRKAPGYKLAKMLAGKLTSYNPLPSAYNVTNMVQLMNDLTDIPYNHNKVCLP